MALSPDGVSDPSSAASLDDAALDDAIAEAQDEIDARLAGRYPVPFGQPPFGPTIPPIVHIIARDLAAYNATLTFFKGTPIPEGHPVLRRYQRADARLDDLVRGRIELADIVPEETPPSSVATENPYEGTAFSPDDFGIGPVPPRQTGSRGWNW